MLFSGAFPRFRIDTHGLEMNLLGCAHISPGAGRSCDDFARNAAQGSRDTGDAGEEAFFADGERVEGARSGSSSTPIVAVQDSAGSVKGEPRRVGLAISRPRRNGEAVVAAALSQGECCDIPARIRSEEGDRCSGPEAAGEASKKSETSLDHFDRRIEEAKVDR
jgi:hypothetical protein